MSKFVHIQEENRNDIQEITRDNADRIRKENAERTQIEAIKSTAFGEWFIDQKTGKPNRALAGFVLVGLVLGTVICEWYAVANDWAKIRRILFFDVTWGFAIGAFAGIALGLLGYKIFKLCYKIFK